MARLQHSLGWTLLSSAVLVMLAISMLAISAMLPAAQEQPRPVMDEFQFLAHDSFDGRTRLDWKPVRPDLTHVSLTRPKGALTIKTQRGDIHAAEKIDALGQGMQAKNIWLIDNPLAKDVDFTATTSVRGFTPQAPYQQAGLIIYDDDDNYLKWGYEFNHPQGGGQTFVLVRESAAKPQHDYAESANGLNRYWVRVSRRGQRYACAVSTDGKDYHIHFEREWGGQAKKIGILALNGGPPDTPEVDAAFEFFELRAPAAKE
jgi:regulation of enolase protein 1 (concanavalin A-like superfamily)